MDRRIFGVETEFGVFGWRDRRELLDVETIARRTYRPLMALGDGHNAFLSNGARLYLDVGAHPEYATPECDTVPLLIAHEKAGERMVEDLTVRAETQMRADAIPGDIYAFKNNTDAHGNTYGCHENYLVERGVDFLRLARDLTPFLVTRQLIAGSGKVLATPDGPVYCLSQRAPHMQGYMSGDTTHDRTIINTRDEPHADSEKYRRLHLILGDANMSETTMLLKVGTTDLVLRLIEAGARMPRFDLVSPVRAIGQVSRDLTGQVPVKLNGRREVPALGIQEAYFEFVRDELDRRGLSSPADAPVLQLWERTLTATRADDLSRIERDVDWVMKLALIERYRAKHDLPMSSPRVAQLDLAYHDTRRDRGLYYQLEKRGMAHRVVTDVDIRRAAKVPPQHTRAKMRGDLVRRATARRKVYTGDWTTLRVGSGDAPQVICRDPFATRDERVSRLRETL